MTCSELNPKQCPLSNKTDWTFRKVYEEDHALLEENFRQYINGLSRNVDDRNEPVDEKWLYGSDRSIVESTSNTADFLKEV